MKDNGSLIKRIMSHCVNFLFLFFPPAHSVIFSYNLQHLLTTSSIVLCK